MNELLDMCSDLKNDLREISKSLAKIIEIHTAESLDEWKRKEQVLKILRISSRTFDRLIHTGKLPYSKINGLIYINKMDVDRVLKENYK